jgi:hypothetical protein
MSYIIPAAACSIARAELIRKSHEAVLLLLLQLLLALLHVLRAVAVAPAC